LIRFEIHAQHLEDDLFETGAVARSMSFYVGCKLLKLTSSSVSQVEEIDITHNIDVKKTRLETLLPLSGLKRLTTSKWKNVSMPFHQMMNFGHVKLETCGLGNINGGRLSCCLYKSIKIR
jgi:hypothetical protein